MIYRLFFLSLACTCYITALPASTKTTSVTVANPVEIPLIASQDVHLINPLVITIEHFESLLRRASEIFQPVNLQSIKKKSDDSDIEQKQQLQQVAVPHQQMQPPTEQPYNLYMPLFQFDDNNSKLDEKSRRLEKFSPPPELTKEQQSINYYALKPKKLPKKFNAGYKHINMNWLLDLEKQALTGKDGEVTKAVYLVNDERNRINFDDNFFGVDMQVKIPDNEPHKELNRGEQTKAAEYLNQGEEIGEEDDLIAAPTAQLSQVEYLV